MLRESFDTGYFARNRFKDDSTSIPQLQKRIVSGDPVVRWDSWLGRRTEGTNRRVVKITSISIYERYHQSTSLRDKRRNESRCECVRLFTAHVSPLVPLFFGTWPSRPSSLPLIRLNPEYAFFFRREGD